MFSTTRYEDTPVTLKVVADRKKKKVRVNSIVLVSHGLLCHPENYIKQSFQNTPFYFLKYFL